MEPIRETNLPLPLFKRGKVRDLYDLGDRLLIVSTDRISAFDVVLPTPIPMKGMILNKLSEFWFRFTEDITRNHLLTTKPEDVLGIPQLKELESRWMLVTKTEPIKVECTVRGYLYGSAWKEYQRSGSLWGIEVPRGLKLADKLPEPVFTPTTKEEKGHDRPLTEDEIVQTLGRDIFETLKEISLRIYERCAKYAERRGIIIADTKLEFGWRDGELVLIDELLTPDSSRFWPADSYEPGKPQLSLDKQFVRDYLESIGWDKKPPAPELPPEIVKETSSRYLEIMDRLLA